MLHEKLLPTGLGHTTNCFIQVEGSNSSDGYILTDDNTDPTNISVRFLSIINLSLYSYFIFNLLEYLSVGQCP